MSAAPHPLPARRPLRRRLQSWFRRLGLAAWDYLKTFHLKKFRGPVEFLRRMWSLGWATRVVLGALVVGGVATGIGLDGQRAAPAAGVTGMLDGLEVAFFGLAWSVAVAAATALPAWGFVLVGAWFCQTSILALGAVKFTPLMVVPTWWLVVTGWRLCVTDPRRWRGVVTWLVLSAGAGYATAGPSGFRQALELPRGPGQMLAGVLYAVAGLLWWWRGRRQTRTRPDFAGTLAVTLPLMAGLMAIAWWRDRGVTVAWMPDLFRFVDAVVFLFWLWSGGEAFLGTWKVLDWSLGHIVRLNLTRLLVWLLPVVSGLALAAEWVIAYGAAGRDVARWVPGFLAAWLAPVLHRIETVPLPVEFACAWHRWLMTVLLLGAWVRHAQGKLTVRDWIAAGGFAIVTFAGLMAYVAGGLAIVARAQGGAGNPGLWALLMGVLALLLGFAGVQKDWRGLSATRVGGHLGWMTAAFAIVLTARITKGVQAEVEQLLYLHLGMIYFGLARVAYERLARRSAAPARLTLAPQAVAALLGMACGWAGLMVSGGGGVTLWIPLLPAGLWWLALVVMQRRAPDWDRLAGAMAGALLGAGTLFYTLTPFPVNLPFVSGELVTPAAILQKRAPLGEMVQGGLVLLYTVVAGGFGWWVFRGRAGQPRVLSAVATAKL